MTYAMRFLGYLRVLIHYLFNADVSWTLQFTSSGRRAAWYIHMTYIELSICAILYVYFFLIETITIIIW